MSIADAMASNGMKDAGYEYINLDGTTVLLSLSSRDTCIDCWADHRDDSGTFVPDKTRFPE